jgi:hypothetical protein
MIAKFSVISRIKYIAKLVLKKKIKKQIYLKIHLPKIFILVNYDLKLNNSYQQFN